MAELKITELSPSGFELFQDSESFLEDLTDNDLDNINGAGSQGMTLISIHSNSIHNNTIGESLEDLKIDGVDIQDVKDVKKLNLRGYNLIGQTVNAKTVGNFNTVKAH